MERIFSLMIPTLGLPSDLGSIKIKWQPIIMEQIKTSNLDSGNMFIFSFMCAHLYKETTQLDHK